MCKRPLVLLATLAVLASLLLDFVEATSAAASDTKMLAAGSGNGTALLFGGTGQPSGEEIAGTVGMERVRPGSTVVAVSTTANFAPVYGPQSYDVSKYDGAARIVKAVKSTPGQKTIVTYSLSTVSADIALRQLQAEHYDLSNVTIVKVANARRNGTTQGIETVFPTFAVPGITSGGAEAQTGARTYDYCGQYDPVCDAPLAGSPAESYLNAVLCYFMCHANYGPTQVNRQHAVVEQRGNTTYITYRRQAPLTALTGIPVPDSLASRPVQTPPPGPVAAPHPAQPAAAPVVAPPPAPVPAYVPPAPPVYVPPVPVYTPPPVPVVTQTQVQQVAQQVTQAVPQAAPVVQAITSNPVVSNFLKGLPR